VRLRSCHRTVVLPLVLGLLLSIVAGCAATPHQTNPGQRHLFGPWQPVPNDQAGVRFTTAPAPGIVMARQRTGHDGERITEVMLANETVDYGANQVLIAFREQADDRPLAVDSEVLTFRFTPAMLDRNVELLLKGARRTSEPAPRRNRYGPYSFVTAEYPGSSHCVYAWQHIDGSAMGYGHAGGDATVQFRFCDPHRDSQALIELFDGIVLNL
jgi:hypothetical protein